MCIKEGVVEPKRYVYLNTGLEIIYIPSKHCFSAKLAEKHLSTFGIKLELITFEILAAERLRLMGFDNRLIIECFANVVKYTYMVIFYK